MTSSTPSSSSVLDFFYNHIDEYDWLDGVDLYQAGKVGKVQNMNGLVLGKVSERGVTQEVRLKVHPAGHQIQWLECTCVKNRTKGYYCEHLAAMMLHIDRELPNIFKKLDVKMPLKPPANQRRPKNIDKVEQASTHSSAQEMLLNHLDSAINSVSLIGNGPQLRVRVEMKQGQLTNYDLNLDGAAKFLQNKSNLARASTEVKALKVFSEPAYLGSRVTLVSPNEVRVERVVAIPVSTKKFGEKAVLFAPGEEKGSTGKFQFFPIKEHMRYLGQQFFFQAEQGYWPLSATAPEPSWRELPTEYRITDDAAAELVASRFAAVGKHSTYWVDPELNASRVETSKLKEIRIKSYDGGWFTLDPRYGEGKTSVSMVDLLKAYNKKHQAFHRTETGWIKVPELVKQFAWTVDESGDYLKVDTLGLMRLRAALGEFDQFAGSKRMLDQIRNKVEFTPIDKAPDLKSSQLYLRGYQLEGLQWLWWLYKNNLHGLLADEMGLGKTHQTMALLTAIKNEDPKAKFLVVAPTTVLDHWYDKLQKFCPNLRPMKHHGAKRSTNLRDVAQRYDVVLTSYGILLKDIRHLNTVTWNTVILDEAHFVKNSDTATYQAACQLNAGMRLCLTGTPMENRVSELKNIFDFLVPGYLGSDQHFKEHYLNQDPDGDDENEIALQKLIHPLKMRRTKNLVLDDLPEKVEDVRHCELSDEQIKLYREVVEMKARPLVAQLETQQSPIPYLHVFATLNLLKQICDHPALLQPNSNYKKHESAKFELLKELLNESLDSEHKVVIFSQYLGMIRIISEFLTENRIGFVTLTGESRNRGEIIKSFQEDPETKVFVGSLLAGGVGIDLTAASVVIHYDRWWNASKENQATDRVHRIGQTKNVQVLKLVTKGTLEEKIDAMIRSKQALFEKFLDKDEELFKALSRQEIIELLT